MKNNIMIIMKKEFTRFFTDGRMVLTTLILPGIMIYFIYSFMGGGLASQFETDDDYVAKVAVENLPDSISMMISKEVPIKLTNLTSEEEKKGEMANLKEGEKKCDLIAVFPKEFDAQVADYDVTTKAMAPKVEIYYNSTSTESQTAYKMLEKILNGYEATKANKFDINPGAEGYDLATKEDTTAMMFSMMIPMLMIMFLFSGCMAVAPESIAGEKERGTIATLLVTPMKRSHLALGKIISLSAIAILSGCSSFLGTMLSLPKLMGGMEGMNASVYKIKDYIMLLFVILSTVLVIIAIISIVSAFAKNVKEATGWVTPIMIVSMLVGITSMVEGLCKTESIWYLIPLYNSVQSMNGIFSLNMNVTNIAVTVISNICYTAVGVAVLTKMFNSEKVMFSK
ncbi:MAG: ABC transporter permease subunit [Lachnospiraceae bacterium]